MAEHGQDNSNPQPPAQLQKTNLDANVTAMLRQRSKGPQRLAKETQRYFTVPAGDNSAEGIFGTVKIV